MLGERRLNDQDIQTWRARAPIQTPQSTCKDQRGSFSFPIYCPGSYRKPLEASFFPRLLPFGFSSDMEARPQPRNASSSSLGTSTHFEYGRESPLTIASSADYSSNRTCLTSTLSSPTADIYARMPDPARSYHKQPMTLAHSMLENGAPARRSLMTPQRFGRRPPSPARQDFGKAYQPRVPGEGFRKLPEEILLNILAELKKDHLAPSSLSCSTCWVRDLISIGATSKKWWGAARAAMYEDVQLNGQDSLSHIKKRFKIKHGSRLKLLRRTLQARPDLASYVKSLKVPVMPESAKSEKDQEEYMDLVASLIMACPNLERLPGMYPMYRHEYTKFDHALSTRKNLLERVWIISGSSSNQHYEVNLSEAEYPTPIVVPNLPLPDQYLDFLDLHSNWFKLKTLVMHCNLEGMMSSPLFTDVFASLPSLEYLHLSSFSAAAFNNETLMSLPSLLSLRLENLPGVTDDGLSKFAALARTDRLKTLSLISLSLYSLPVLARLFSHLKSLTEFTLSQAQSLSGVDVFLYPYLASVTLKSIHWEITSHGDEKATEILSKSISHSGFPNLVSIRAPTDYDGRLQKLCRPRNRIELSGDKYRNIANVVHAGLSSSQSMPILPEPTAWAPFRLGHSYSRSLGSSHNKSLVKSAFSSNMDSCSDTSEMSDNTCEKGMSLAIARRLAQGRAEAAKAKPKYHIIVWDENGDFQERHAVGGYLGELHSQIEYNLKPDLDGSDESLMGVEALLDDTEEIKVRDGCTGLWNADLSHKGSSSSRKKRKDRWLHTERGRWKDLSLSTLF